MRKLRYNVYDNIYDEQYLNIQDKLTRLEAEMALILKSMGLNWHTDPPSIRKDGLFVSFILYDSDFYGSFGIHFDNQPNAITFTFGLVKSYDVNGHRYLLNYEAFINKELGFFENDIPKYLYEVLDKYNNWSKQDLLNSDLTVKLGYN